MYAIKLPNRSLYYT
ncbi:uncharacterized protein FFMR_14017 [Fusarium fujikuroi]|nr:uncharacterized protein FFMR_14017 [Fusarium fujikuroi]